MLNKLENTYFKILPACLVSFFFFTFIFRANFQFFFFLAFGSGSRRPRDYADPDPKHWIRYVFFSPANVHCVQYWSQIFLI